MNKPSFCWNFFLIDWRHKCLKNTIDIFLFYGQHFNIFLESDLPASSFAIAKMGILPVLLQSRYFNQFLNNDFF